MICPNFYDKLKTTKLYLNSKAAHYIVREPTKVLETYEYTIQEGETMYTLAVKVFGDERSHLWTIIAEINFLKDPESWLPGETINLPLVVLNDPETRSSNYAEATSNTRPII